jgi:WD40 repeat protein
MVERARRRRRIRRLALTTVVAASLAVAVVVGVSRQQAAKARDEARVEARRAEASKLLALAQLRFEEDPTEALAFTTASLDLADTEEARTFTMRILGEAPPALELETGSLTGASRVGFSPNGEYLAAAGTAEEARVWSEDGQGPVVLPGHLVDAYGWNWPGWTSTGLLVTGPGLAQDHLEHRLHVWSLPEGRRVRTIELGGPSLWQVGPEHLFAQTFESRAPDGQPESYLLRSWLLPDGEPEELGRVDWTALGASSSCFEPDGKSWLYSKGRAVYRRLLPIVEGAPDQLLSRHEEDVTLYDFPTLQPRRVFSLSGSGEIRLWASGETQPELVKQISKPEAAPAGFFLPDPSGRWVLGVRKGFREAPLWSTTAWPGARPLVLKRSGSWNYGMANFDPRGDWFVMPTQETARLTFWPMRRVYPTVVDADTTVDTPVFSEDSHRLATSMGDRTVRLWPLPGTGSPDVRTLGLPESSWMGLAFAPRDEFLLAVAPRGQVVVAPLDGSPARELEGFSTDRNMIAAAVSPSGGRVATASAFGPGKPRLAVWNLETGEPRFFDLPKASTAAGWSGAVFGAHFMDEDTLVTAGDGGVRRWDLETGANELVWATPPGEFTQMWVTSDGGRAVVRRQDPGEGRQCQGVEILDLTSGTAKSLPAFGDCFAMGDVIGTSGPLLVTGDVEGVVRVGRLSGEEPHRLLGHEGAVNHVAISPDLRWVASTGEDNTLRLWPVPNLDEPPLHTLPHDELLAKLRSLTNLRAVRDPEAPNGWSIALDDFPGWKEVPEW